MAWARLGHFYAYAPSRVEYCIDRFAMETKRQLDVLGPHLADNRSIWRASIQCGDMGDLGLVWSGWFGRLYDALKSLNVDSYENPDEMGQDNRCAARVDAVAVWSTVPSVNRNAAARTSRASDSTPTQDKIDANDRVCRPCAARALVL